MDGMQASPLTFPCDKVPWARETAATAPPVLGGWSLAHARLRQTNGTSLTRLEFFFASNSFDIIRHITSTQLQVLYLLH